MKKGAKRAARGGSAGEPKRRAKNASTKGRSKRTATPTDGRAAPTPEQMVELVARYVSAFNRGDVEAIVSLYHPRATMEDPVGYTPARGHRAIGTVYQGGFRQGVTIVLDGAIRCAGGSVAFPVVARTPQATLQSVNVFDLSPDGRIERMRAYWGPYNVVGEIAVRG
ncbi:MAG: nuclear transport factor 2 family protein [Myxococcota bacterium]